MIERAELPVQRNRTFRFFPHDDLPHSGAKLPGISTKCCRKSAPRAPLFPQVQGCIRRAVCDHCDLLRAPYISIFRQAVYGYKTLVEGESGRILGAHLVGPHADEVINLFGLAIRHNLTADDLKTTMFAYPTGASDIGYML